MNLTTVLVCLLPRQRSNKRTEPNNSPTQGKLWSKTTFYEMESVQLHGRFVRKPSRAQVFAARNFASAMCFQALLDLLLHQNFQFCPTSASLRSVWSPEGTKDQFPTLTTENRNRNATVRFISGFWKHLQNWPENTHVDLMFSVHLMMLNQCRLG